MHNYKELLQRILLYGTRRETRRGSTIALFGERLEFNLADSFPAVTVKKLYFESVAGELAGFLRAETNAKNMGSNIWLSDTERWWNTPGSNSRGVYDMGRVYGVQWRRWNDEIDQIREVVCGLKENPHERYHLVTAWNPSDRLFMCLEPCHYAFQFFVEDNRLSCMFQMRSVDCFLGLPFDIASYALLTNIIAQSCDLKVGKLIASLGDTHIYENHLPQVREVLRRTIFKGPKLLLHPLATVDNFEPEMAVLRQYKCHPAVKAEMNNEQVG